MFALREEHCYQILTREGWSSQLYPNLTLRAEEAGFAGYLCQLGAVIRFLL